MAFGCLCLGEIIVYLALKSGLDRALTGINPILKNPLTYIALNGWRGLYFVGIGSGYFLIRKNFEYREASHEIEKKQLFLQNEKTRLELNLSRMHNAYIEHQMNPHLLFNTLNFFYNTIPDRESAASKGVLLLSDIMRYSLEDRDADGNGLLNDELEQIRNLADLNRLRLGEKMLLDFSVQNDSGELRILPLILFTFAENLFKYGYLTGDESKNVLRISTDKNVLTYYSLNRKKAAHLPVSRRQLGVKNTIERLNYVYPEKYDLRIREDEETYELTLTLTL